MQEDTGAANSIASLIIDRFARRCAEHPMIEDDPVCVIATVREQMMQELQEKREEIAPRAPAPAKSKASRRSA